MSSNIISPSIDQGALEMFQDNFHEMAQQSKSKLVGAGIFKFLPSKGKTHHYARIGRLNLVEVEGRNPNKQYGDYALDNRQFSKRRFTRTITVDAKHDMNELLKDPTSNIISELDKAKERVVDRIGLSAAVGSVLTGAPDAAPTTTTAAQDGVITVDASAGVTYAKVLEVTENYINNDLDESDFEGACWAITGTEHTDLMNEDKFINNDYMNDKPVAAGQMNRAGLYRLKKFAGSKTGGITVTNPIVPEGATLRSCAVMAPESVVMSMELNKMGVEKSATKVNSYDITIDFWINAMRTEGARVQIVSTTI